MPLTEQQIKKLDPEFYRALKAMGEAIIASKIPVSMAYALRDGQPFEAWPDDAIEATARLMREANRRLIEAAIETSAKLKTEAEGAGGDVASSPAPGASAPAPRTGRQEGGNRGRHGRGSGRGTGSAASPTEKPPAAPTEPPR